MSAGQPTGSGHAWMRVSRSQIVSSYLSCTEERVIHLNASKMNAYREYLTFVLEIAIEEIKHLLSGNRNFIL